MGGWVRDGCAQTQLATPSTPLPCCPLAPPPTRNGSCHTPTRGLRCAAPPLGMVARQQGGVPSQVVRPSLRCLLRRPSHPPSPHTRGQGIHYFRDPRDSRRELLMGLCEGGLGDGGAPSLLSDPRQRTAQGPRPGPRPTASERPHHPKRQLLQGRPPRPRARQRPAGAVRVLQERQRLRLGSDQGDPGAAQRQLH